MNLIPVLNVEETQNKVRNFLENEFPRYVLKSGFSMVDVQSPNFSLAPQGSHFGNSVESKMIDHLNSPHIVESVLDAINRCPHFEKIILTKCYVQELEESQIMAQIPMGRTKYYQTKSKALLLFADAFENTIDLHVYLKTRTKCGPNADPERYIMVL